MGFKEKEETQTTSCRYRRRCRGDQRNVRFTRDVTPKFPFQVRSDTLKVSEGSRWINGEGSAVNNGLLATGRTWSCQCFLDHHTKKKKEGVRQADRRTGGVSFFADVGKIFRVFFNFKLVIYDVFSGIHVCPQGMGTSLKQTEINPQSPKAIKSKRWFPEERGCLIIA